MVKRELPVPGYALRFDRTGKRAYFGWAPFHRDAVDGAGIWMWDRKADEFRHVYKGLASLADISPDGRRLIIRERTGRAESVIESLKLLETETFTPVYEEPDDGGSLRFTNDGRGILSFRRPNIYLLRADEVLEE